MINTLDLFFQGSHILFRHIVENKECKCSLIEILQKFILANDCFHIFRQVGQHIIVYTGCCHTDDRWDHQKHRQN